MVSALREEVKGTKLRICTVRPAAVDTPWWAEASRGGRDEAEIPLPRSVMIAPEAVGTEICNVLLQHESLNIRSVNLEPGLY